MEWHDQGIILSVRPHSETNAVVEIFTKTQGRCLGLVHGGRSRTKRPMLQVGNYVDATWRARLSEHLGMFRIELMKAHAAFLLEDRLALAALNSLCALVRLLPERDPHQGLYEACMLILEHIDNSDIWPSLLVRWELELLNELGFGLDFSKCAATGQTEDLVYVSPKSGRAVSTLAGQPYHDSLLKLPAFLLRQTHEASQNQSVLDGFALTGFFLEKYIMQPRGLDSPEARARLISYLKKRFRE